MKAVAQYFNDKWVYSEISEKNYDMMKADKFLMRQIIIALGLIVLQSMNAGAAIEGLELYSPYTAISVSPGKTVSYSMDLINNDDHTRNEYIKVSNMPLSWSYSLTAGAYNIKRIAILSGEKKTITMKVHVPYQVRKGNYTFYVKAGDNVSLPLTINVSSAGSSESELTCEQKNMEGTAKSSFTFKAVLKNQTPTTQQYALMASAPRGWVVVIKPNYKQATSTELEANSTKNISYEIKPPASVMAGSYKIPVKAVAGSSSTQLEFEVVITGTYEMSLNTPTGLVSARMTAGDEKKLEFIITNKGSAELNNIDLYATKPKNWEVTFDSKKIDKLAPGHTETVYANIVADKKAIPGDYIVKVSAKTPEVNSVVSLRIAVRTSLLVGWIGILVIIVALGGVFYLFKKFGRR